MAHISLYEKQFVKMLKPLQKGFLHMTLPSGSEYTSGNKNSEIRASLHIKDVKFFKRILFYGDIGFAESFMHGEWETEDLTLLLKWFLLNIENAPTLSGSKASLRLVNIMRFVNNIFHWRRKNSIHGSQKNITDHYDLSNNFFSLFLDESMTYSSGYYVQPEMKLEDAQHAKYKNICTSIKLKVDDHVLEIGTGWGGFAEYTASHYGCKVTSVTISEKQYQFALDRIQRAGLSHLVEIRLQDYRKVEGKFDKVVSIEMIEAVGAKYLRTYFEKIHQVLKSNGVLALQAIICPDNRFDTLRNRVDFIQKHIFPGSLLPSVSAINSSINATGEMFLFQMTDMGKSYAMTLDQWKKNFNTQLQEIRNLGFSEEFIRKWQYYFSYCEAAFDMRNINVVQMVYTRPNNIHY